MTVELVKKRDVAVDFVKVIATLLITIMYTNLTRIINRRFSSSTYIIAREGSNNVWLVDCGEIAVVPHKGLFTLMGKGTVCPGYEI